MHKINPDRSGTGKTNNKQHILKEGIKLSSEFGPDVHLHLHMGQILFWNLPSNIRHHHVKTSEVPVELPCRFYQRLPVTQVLTHVVFCHLIIYILQLHVECYHYILIFRKVPDLVSQLDQFLFHLF